MADGPRAQLIHIDVDRRLGHEWDEWDGQPLPNGGNYDSAPDALLPLVRGGARRRGSASPRSRSSCSPRGSPPSITPLPTALWIACG